MTADTENSSWTVKALENSQDRLVLPYNPEQAENLLDNAEATLNSCIKRGGMGTVAGVALLHCTRRSIKEFVEKFHYNPEYFPEVFRGNLHLVEQLIRLKVLDCKVRTLCTGESTEEYKHFKVSVERYAEDLLLIRSVTHDVKQPSRRDNSDG